MPQRRKKSELASPFVSLAWRSLLLWLGHSWCFLLVLGFLGFRFCLAPPVCPLAHLVDEGLEAGCSGQGSAKAAPRHSSSRLSSSSLKTRSATMASSSVPRSGLVL